MFTKNPIDIERKQEMIRLRGLKWSLQKIGNKYGICRERVRQLIGNTGYYLKYPMVKKLRYEELIQVKKYLWLHNEELAELYYIPFNYFLRYIKNIPHVHQLNFGFSRCCSCRKILPYCDFYDQKHPSRCKKCTDIHVKQYQKKSGYLKKYNKKYLKGGIYYIKSCARAAVSQALKKGKLIKGICSLKDNTCHGRIEANHWHGYDKEHWLDVQWLCTHHHQESDKTGWKYNVLDK